MFIGAVEMKVRRNKSRQGGLEEADVQVFRRSSTNGDYSQDENHGGQIRQLPSMLVVRKKWEVA